MRRNEIRKDMNQRYIITPDHILRGWKALPFGIQHLHNGRTEFLPKAEYLLLAGCDGRHDINRTELSERENALLEHWLKCGFIRPAEPGETLLPKQEYVLYDSRYKESVQWSITGKCNFRCRHCFMSAPHAMLGEPTFDQCVKMLDDFARCGIRTINLTGGEPLVRRDFWELVDRILEKDLRIGVIYSNGKLTDETFFQKLLERNIHPDIQFSYDGVGWHDWLRGVDGAEEMVKKALIRCSELGFRTSCSMCLFRENRNTLRESVNLLKELGCGALKVNVTSPQGEWLQNQEHILTQDEAYQAYMDYLPYYFEDGTPIPLMLEGFFVYEKSRKRVASAFERNCREKDFGKCAMCGHVRSTLYVSPEGRTLPCMSLAGTPVEAQFPNMLETPLEEILNNSKYWEMSDMRVSDYMEHNPDCRECEYREGCCGGCRAMALRTGVEDYLAPDLWTCAYFRDGWKAGKDKLILELQQKYGFTIDENRD